MSCVFHIFASRGTPWKAACASLSPSSCHPLGEANAGHHAYTNMYNETYMNPKKCFWVLAGCWGFPYLKNKSYQMSIACFDRYEIHIQDVETSVTRAFIIFRRSCSNFQNHKRSFTKFEFSNCQLPNLQISYFPTFTFQLLSFRNVQTTKLSNAKSNKTRKTLGT